MSRRLTICAAGVAFLLAAAPVRAAVIYFQPGFTDDLKTFDTVTLAESKVGDMGLADSWGFAFSPSGALYGFHRASQSLYTIDTNTALPTLVGATGLVAESLAFNLAGDALYVSAGSSLYSLDPSNANATLIGNVGVSADGLTVAPFAVNVQGLGVLPAGSLFATDSNTLYFIDVAGVSSTLVGGVSADETLDFDPSTGVLYGHNAGNFSVIGLNPLGSAVLGPTSDRNVFAMAIQPVPEPATILLFGIAAAAVARRRILG